jgi:hypothetical protein
MQYLDAFQEEFCGMEDIIGNVNAFCHLSLLQ